MAPMFQNEGVMEILSEGWSVGGAYCVGGVCFYTVLMCNTEDMIRPEEEPLKYQNDVRDMWTLSDTVLKGALRNILGLFCY